MKHVDRTLARVALMITSAAVSTVGIAQIPSRSTSASPYAERLARAYSRLGNNLLVIRSRSTPAAGTENAFHQEPGFFYFTGDERLLGAVLIIDGGARRAELFVPTELPADLRF